MTIKEIRLQEHLSQSAFAAKYSIKLRTLQDWEQGRYEPPSYLLRLFESSLKSYERLPEIKKSNTFKVCIKDPFMNADRIYPIQQERIKTILDEIRNNPNVNKVIVFGSSVTSQCHIDSDIDIYIELTKDEKPLNNIFDFEIDVWTNYMVDQRLKNEILSKGVTVYERDIS